MLMKRICADSALGPDGVSVGALSRWDSKGVKIAQLMHDIIRISRVPALLKESRTTLIPKAVGKAELADISNWRPITISSVLTRILSGCIRSRLADALPVHPSQRGFIDSPGCTEKLTVLDGLVRSAASSPGCLAVMFIDLRKAFASVSHQHRSQEVLRQRGVDPGTRRLIRSAYTKTFTRIGLRGGATGPIEIRIGVKQGDPLSPHLFNLALDPLLYALEADGAGVKVGPLTVTTLAFADGLVISSDSDRGMRENLRACGLTRPSARAS